LANKLAVMLGAGNVGRGFLGQLFSESGYEVVFVDVDEPLIAALKARGGYTIRLVDADGAIRDSAEEVTVSPVWALHAREVDAVAGALAGADIAATAVGVRALPHIAPLVAAGVVRRAERRGERPAGGNPLNVIVCENMPDAAATFRRMVGAHVPKADQAYFLAHVGFVDTVIARMAPPPTPEMRARDPSLIMVEPYKELPVDGAAFVGRIPKIVGMEPCANFGFYVARKLHIHNAGHALLGYLGYVRGHAFGYQALADGVIHLLLERAMTEAQAGIVHEYGADAVRLEAHVADLLRRFGNRALGDTVFRLARDPLRKLGPRDRLVGAARLAEKAGVVPETLSWGIAGGYRFDSPEDPLAVALQRRTVEEGFDAVIADVSGIAAEEPLGVLVRERYERLSAVRTWGCSLHPLGREKGAEVCDGALGGGVGVG